MKSHSRRSIRRWFFREGRGRDRTCSRCLVRMGKNYLQVDHVRPLFLGGSERSPKNLQALCRWCHTLKGRDEARVQREMRDGAGRAWGIRWLAERWGAGAGS